MELKVTKKPQKVPGNYNYYFTSESNILELTLYNPKVIFVKSTFIVLEFTKKESLSLLNKLRSMDIMFKNLVISSSSNSEINWYPMHSEQEETFSIRLHLPQIRNSYKIDYYITEPSTNETVKYAFTLPRVSAKYNKAVVNVKNVWETSGKFGYNIELKSVYV